MSDTYTCPNCAGRSVLRHLFVLTDRLCIDCAHEWSVAPQNADDPEQAPPHTAQQGPA